MRQHRRHPQCSCLVSQVVICQFKGQILCSTVVVAERSLACNMVFRDGVHRAKNLWNKLSAMCNIMFLYYTNIESGRRANASLPSDGIINEVCLVPNNLRRASISLAA